MQVIYFKLYSFYCIKIFDFFQGFLIFNYQNDFCLIFYCKKKNGVIIKKYFNLDSIEQDLGKLSYIVNIYVELF